MLLDSVGRQISQTVTIRRPVLESMTFFEDWIMTLKRNILKIRREKHFEDVC